MKTIFILLVGTFSLHIFADNPFKIKQENINRKGQYVIIQEQGVPVHEDYLKIFQYTKDGELKKSSDGKYFVTTTGKGIFQIFVPESYDPKNPPGILCLSVNDWDGIDYREIINSIKAGLTQRNLISVCFRRIKNDISGQEIACENAVYIRRSIDIIKERYKVDDKRIIGYSYSGILSLSIAVFTCPDIFRYNVFRSGTIPFVGGFSSYKGPELDFKKIANNKYIYYIIPNYPKTEKFIIVPRKRMYDFDKIKKKYKIQHFEMAEYNPEDPEKLTDFSDILEFIDKVDPKLLTAKKFLEEAIRLEKMKKYAEAFSSYKIAAQNGSQSAQKKYSEMNNILTKEMEKMNKAHNIRNYPDAYKSAVLILKKFGAANSPESQKIYKTYIENKAIVMEIKAEAFLAKVEAALKTRNPSVDKIKAACKKVIETCPGTYTAKKAQAIIDKIK